MYLIIWEDHHLRSFYLLIVVLLSTPLTVLPQGLSQISFEHLVSSRVLHLH